MLLKSVYNAPHYDATCEMNMLDNVASGQSLLFISVVLVSYLCLFLYVLTIGH